MKELGYLDTYTHAYLLPPEKANACTVLEASQDPTWN